jgi:hypothetical protein
MDTTNGKREFRCTRDYPYSNPGCLGFRDAAVRQGHYIAATDEDDARRQMAKLFPEDGKAGYGFTVEFWK